MKPAAVLFALLLASVSAKSQLVLNQGDVWTHTFNSLPLTGTTNSFLTSAQGVFEFHVQAGTLQSGDTLRYDMFENGASETPICSQTIAFGSPLTATCSSPNAWADLQGVIRLTMLSGSLTVDNVHLEAIVSGPSLSSFNVYSTSFNPVPEPSFFFLCAAGCVTSLVVRRFRKRTLLLPAP
jgi:hypothetical protein